MLKRVIVTSIILLSVSNLYGEGNITKAVDSNKTAKKELSSKEAAYKLLDIMNYKATADKTVAFYTNRLINANSDFKKVEDKIKAFYEKYIGWNSVRDKFAKLYAKYFTAEELNQIAEFYQTKTGKKALNLMGKLTLEGQNLIQDRYRKHLNELKDILDSVAKKDSNNSTKKEKK